MNKFYFKEVFNAAIGKTHRVEVYRTHNDIKVWQLRPSALVGRREKGMFFSLGMMGHAIVVELYNTKGS